MGEKECKIRVEGMTCVSCAGSIEKTLKAKPGVLDAKVHFASNRAIVLYDPGQISEKKLLEGIHESGYIGDVVEEGTPHVHGGEGKSFQKFFVSALLTLPLMLEMVGMFFGSTGSIPQWIQLILASVVQFYCGASFYRSSYYSLKASSANMDVLIALGTSAAYFFSLLVVALSLSYPTYFESSATIITLVLLGRWLEERSKQKASESIQKMLSLQPEEAKVKREGFFVSLPTKEIILGDVFLVRPGESVAVDGVVIEGESSVDESTLTGESLPVYKAEGEKVFAGTINANGSLTVRATGVGSMTVLNKMAKLVEQAQTSKAPIQKLADQISEIFVPAVTVVSILTFLGWLGYGASFSTALTNAVAVLVIACPCALGLATPTVILVATGIGAERGVLFKTAEALELAQKLTTLIVDKTGTLTQGKPELEEVLPEQGEERSEILLTAASLSHHSAHPLSEAILRLAERQGLTPEPVLGLESIVGKGIRGTKRGELFTLGSARLADEEGISYDREKVIKFQMLGKTVSLLWNPKKTLGYFIIADSVREGAEKAVHQLQKMGISVIMMTGDSKLAAEAVASKLGIEHYFAGVLPDQKAAKVLEAKDQSHLVGMVGDGVNDAPALATADVGFAIDRGSDIAIEAADVTLLNGDILGVLKAIGLSKAAYKKIKQNLFFAFVYNILGIPLAALGYLNPIIAAAAMAASSLSVVTNALLLKKWEPK